MIGARLSNFPRDCVDAFLPSLFRFIYEQAVVESELNIGDKLQSDSAVFPGILLFDCGISSHLPEHFADYSLLHVTNFQEFPVPQIKFL